MPGQKRVFALDVPGIHVSTASQQERRGWPGLRPAMTNKPTIFIVIAQRNNPSEAVIPGRAPRNDGSWIASLRSQ